MGGGGGGKGAYVFFFCLVGFFVFICLLLFCMGCKKITGSWSQRIELSERNDKLT